MYDKNTHHQPTITFFHKLNNPIIFLAGSKIRVNTAANIFAVIMLRKTK